MLLIAPKIKINKHFFKHNLILFFFYIRPLHVSTIILLNLAQLSGISLLKNTQMVNIKIYLYSSIKISP